MRTANWDVIRLSKMITKGMTVIIEGPPPAPRPVIVAKKSEVRRALPVSTEPPPAAPKKWFKFWKKDAASVP
jgi:hypothetical protein